LIVLSLAKTGGRGAKRSAPIRAGSQYKSIPRYHRLIVSTPVFCCDHHGVTAGWRGSTLHRRKISFWPFPIFCGRTAHQSPVNGYGFRKICRDRRWGLLNSRTANGTKRQCTKPALPATPKLATLFLPVTHRDHCFPRAPDCRCVWSQS